MNAKVNRNFHIALVYAGMTVRDFARSQRVSEQAIHQTLNGSMRSARLESEIRDFTLTYLTDLSGEI